VLFDPIYEFPRTTISWCNFLNFVLKKICLVLLMVLLKFFQSSSFFKSLCFSSSFLHSLFHHNFECFMILMIFESLSQILFVLLADSYTTKIKSFFIWNILHIEALDIFNKFSNELVTFFAVLDNCTLFGMNLLFINCNIDSEWDVIWREFPLWMNYVIINLQQIWTKKHEINNWVGTTQVVQIPSRDLVGRFRHI